MLLDPLTLMPEIFFAPPPPLPGVFAHRYHVPGEVRSVGDLNACCDRQSDPLTRGCKKVSDGLLV